MTKTVIYKPDDGPSGNKSRFTNLTRGDIDNCIADFSKLFFPSSYNEEINQSLTNKYGDWIITTDTDSETQFSFRYFLNQVQVDHLAKQFKDSLTKFSGARPYHLDHSPLLGHFDLSRFCEYRAAAAAAKIPGIKDVAISRPNSTEDKGKTDLVVNTGSSKKTLQIKAREGKKGRTDPNVPTLRNVYTLCFSEIKERIKDLIFR